MATNGTANGSGFVVPEEMKAIRYNKVKDFALVTMPVPKPKAHEILIKGTRWSPALLISIVASDYSHSSVLPVEQLWKP